MAEPPALATTGREVATAPSAAPAVVDSLWGTSPADSSGSVCAIGRRERGRERGRLALQAAGGERRGERERARRSSPGEKGRGSVHAMKSRRGKGRDSRSLQSACRSNRSREEQAGRASGSVR
eukprot:scaffold273690_cov32-Tisochrysis_lutea.AAC.1